jgi:hypothetical protein
MVGFYILVSYNIPPISLESRLFSFLADFFITFFLSLLIFLNIFFHKPYYGSQAREKVSFLDYDVSNIPEPPKE